MFQTEIPKISMRTLNQVQKSATQSQLSDAQQQDRLIRRFVPTTGRDYVLINRWEAATAMVVSNSFFTVESSVF